ncbi:MAG: hypothetical protein MUO76_17165, partial [Anaerolineaceae bacterium]|nr:hypothetical protein [Anaerolineaceae bacterium]
FWKNHIIRRLPKKLALIGSVLIILLMGLLLIIAINNLPQIESFGFGFDWRRFYNMLNDGSPKYQGAEISNPPWTIILLLPLAKLPFQISSAILNIPK